MIEPDYSVFVIRHDNFHVVLDPEEIFSYAQQDYRWEWVYSDDKQEVFLYGEEGLYNNLQGGAKNPAFPLVSSVLCASGIN